MMDAYIQHISYCLPQQILTNAEIAELFPEWSAEKVASKVGIDERHIAAIDETAVDMAVKAAENLFKEHCYNRSLVDFVLLCTQSPDYVLPSSACLLQARLGLSQHCGAFDFNLGCSGYEYGLAVAKGLIMAGIAKNILLLTAETYTKYIHPKDKGNRTIFGDAATATIISTTGFAKIGEFVLGTDGEGAESLIVKSRGARHRNLYNDLRIEDGNIVSSDHLYMNGADIFNFTLSTVPTMVKETLVKNNLTSQDVDLYVFHQANQHMLNFIRKKLQIDEEHFFRYMEHVGNTVSNTIPIALYEAQKQDKLHGNILIAGFGVGLSWGATVLTTATSTTPSVAK